MTAALGVPALTDEPDWTDRDTALGALHTVLESTLAAMPLTNGTLSFHPSAADYPLVLAAVARWARHAGATLADAVYGEDPLTHIEVTHVRVDERPILTLVRPVELHTEARHAHS